MDGRTSSVLVFVTRSSLIRWTSGAGVYLALAACAGRTEPPPPSVVAVTPLPTAAPTPAPTTTTPKPKLAVSALYAALFELERAWALTGVGKHSHWDDTAAANVTTTTTWSATCKVSEVRTFSWGLASAVQCDDMPEQGIQNPVSGWWAATAAGLYFLGGEAPTATAPALSRPVLEPSPTEKDVEEHGADGPDFGSRFTVSREEQAWCSMDISWGGDEGWTKVCIAPGAGFVSGTYGWAGGSSEEHEFSAEPLPQAP